MTANSIFRPASSGRRASRFLLPAALALGLGIGLAGCKSSEEEAAEYYQSGLDLLAQGDVDRAVVQFRNVFAVEGTHYEARKTLAEVLAKKGDIAAAYSQYLRLAEQYPDDLPTRIALARMAFEASDVAEFERHATRAGELAPDNPEVQAVELALRYQKASVEENAAARRDVAEEVRVLAQTRPDDPLLLGMMLDAAWRARDAAQIEPLIDRLLALQPGNRLRYQQRLGLLVEKGDMAGVEQHLLATIAQFPDDPQARSELISFYVSQDQQDKAETYLRQRAEAAPVDNSDPRVDLIAFVEFQRGAEAARAETEKALEAGGDPLVFRTLRAGFDFRSGKRAEAIADLRDLLTGVEPTDQTRDIRAQLARLLLQDDQKQAARQEVEQILKENPLHPMALKLTAGWAIDEDRTDDAILSLRSVLDQAPEDVEALGLMANAYRRAGEMDLARDYLAQAADASGNAPGPALRLAGMLADEGRWLPAEDAILPALRADPQNVELLSVLGRIYLSMPDLPRAKGVITQLREIGSEPALVSAEALELSQISAENGEIAAMAYLEDLVRNDDAGLGTRLGLIRARLATGDAEGALTLATDLVAERPEDRGARMLLAMTKAAAGDKTAGRQALQKLIDENPKEVRPYLAMMALLDGPEDRDALRQLLDRGLAEIADQPDLLWAKAGLVERDDGDIDGAIAIYETLYAQNSDSIVIANNLASLLATWYADDPQKVARASTVARRLKASEQPAFMDTYGWIQHLNGDSKAALPYLETAARAMANDMIVQIHLGLVQEALGNPQAKAQLTKAMEMPGADKDSRVVQTARAALERIDGRAASPAAGNGQPAAPATQASN